MIKLITFDLWNTLVSGANTETLREMRITELSKILKRNDFNISINNIEQALQYSWEYFMQEWQSRHYTPIASAMMYKFFSALNIEPNDDFFNEVVKYIEISLLDGENELIDGIEELIFKLHKKYSLAVISDTGYTPGRYLRILLKNLNIYNAFDVFAFSDEIGVSKPDKRIFDYTLNYFNMKPNEALHIGDLLSTDIEGACEAGMHSIHFQRKKFKDELSQVQPGFVTNDACEIFQFISTI